MLVIWEASNPLFSPEKRFCLLVTNVDLIRGECALKKINNKQNNKAKIKKKLEYMRRI